MKFLAICLLLAFNSTYSHDVQIASFTIYEQEDQIYFDVMLEHEDIVHTFAERQKEPNENEIKEYLKDNIEIELNQKECNISFDQIENKSHHIYLKGKLSTPKKKIKTIQIKNTCLLNIEGHSNVIQLRLNNQERDFLINIDRQEIMVKL